MGDQERWDRWLVFVGTVVTVGTGWFVMKEARALDDPRKGDTLSEVTRGALRRLPTKARIPTAAAVCGGFIAFWAWFFIHIVFQGEGVL